MSTGPEPPQPGGSAASSDPVPAAAPGSAASLAAADQSRSGPGGGLERVRLDLAYDGSSFHGFAENAGVDTVAGRLRGALEQVLGVPVALTCAGRTDAGVHARHQVVSFDLPSGLLDPGRLRRSLNSMLGPRVVVHRVAPVDAGFDARFSARWRAYRYQVLDREVPDPFLAPTTWWVDDGLDVDAMDAAATLLVGEHDFSSFCRLPKDRPDASLVRRVLHARWTRSEHEPGLLRFDVVATAFCHQMVRSIVGTLVDLGRGRERVADISSVLAARDRGAAGNLAPPHGLCLWRVGYEGDEPGDPPP